MFYSSDLCSKCCISETILQRKIKKKLKGKSHRKAKIKTYVQSIEINGWFIIFKLTLITLSYKRTPTLRIFGLVNPWEKLYVVFFGGKHGGFQFNHTCILAKKM
jgi:hypothetical protein